MELFKKLEVMILILAFGCSNLVMADELQVVGQVPQTNEEAVEEVQEEKISTEVEKRESEENEAVTEELQATNETENVIDIQESIEPVVVEEAQEEEVVKEMKVMIPDSYTGSETQNIEDFIQRLYENCLGRESDENGLNYWAGQLSSKALNACNILENFLYSTEFKSKGITDGQYIEILYTVCMNRVADEAGVNYWLSLLQNSNRKNVLARFVDSPEFTTVCNAYEIEKGKIDATTESTDQVVNFVQRFYQKCLGRAGDEGGIDYWVRGLKNGKYTGQDIAENFMLSDEFVNRNLSTKDYLEVLYNVFFDRNGDEDGINYWTQLIISGMSNDTVLQSFIDSNEFTKVCSDYGIIKKNENVESDQADDFEFSNGVITKYIGKGGNVVIPSNINGEAVVEIGDDAFSGCMEVTNVIIPTGVTQIGNWAFSNCYNLKSIKMPEGIIGIGWYAFCECTSLESVTIPTSVKVISKCAFDNCKKLKSIIIPDGVTTIGTYAFSECDGLESIEVVLESTSIDTGAFFKCNNLVSCNGKSIVSEGFQCIKGVITNYIGDNEDVIIPNRINGVDVVGIEYGAFFLNDNLRSITIPDEVTEIGSCAFYGCENLKSIQMPKGVTQIGSYAFYDCKSLTSILIPEGLTKILECTFGCCESLESITIPNGVTVIEHDAFSRCRKLMNAVIPKHTIVDHNAFIDTPIEGKY